MPYQFKSLDELESAIGSMTIAELRNVAREFSIIPRNRKREDLIEKIVAVYNGDIKPRYLKNRVVLLK